MAKYGKIDVLPQSIYDSLRNEAVEKAKTADYVIYVGGLNKNHYQDCEGGDRESYQLPFGQDRLITELLAANSNTVLVIVSGNAYDMPWLDKASTRRRLWYSHGILEAKPDTLWLTSFPETCVLPGNFRSHLLTNSLTILPTKWVR